jgi:hypothetical protein
MTDEPPPIDSLLIGEEPPQEIYSVLPELPQLPTTTEDCYHCWLYNVMIMNNPTSEVEPLVIVLKIIRTYRPLHRRIKGCIILFVIYTV